MSRVEPLDVAQIARTLAQFQVGQAHSDIESDNETIDLDELADNLPELKQAARKKSIRLSRQQSIELDLESQAAKEDEIDDLKVETPARTIILMFAVSFCAMTTFAIQLYSINTAMVPMLNFVNQSIQAHYDVEVSSSTLNWIWTSMICLNLFSEGVGMLVSAKITDSKHGRKMGFIVALTIEAISNIGFFLAITFNCVEAFAAMRLLIGFGNGIGVATLTAFVQECTPSKWRGTCACFQELCFSTAALIGLVLGMENLLGTDAGIAYLLLSPIVANIVMFFLIIFAMYESPKHLFLSNGNTEKATRAIKYYHGRRANAKKIIGRYVMERLADDEDDGKSHIFAALKVDYVRRGVLLGTSTLLMQTFSGVYLIAFYSTQLFTNVGMSLQVAQWLSVSMGVLNVTATFIATGILRKFNRRLLLLGSTLIISMCVVTFFSCQKFFSMSTRTHLVWSIIAVAAILIFNIVYSFGTGPIPWFVTSEVVPQKYRSSALGAGQFVNMTVFGVMTLFQFPIYDRFGPFTLLVTATVPTIALWIYLYRKLPETRGKEIAQIVDELCD